MAADTSRDTIILGVRHNKSEKAVVKFRIYTDERLLKLFNAYKNYRNDADPRTVYLWSAPNGAQIKEKQTPQELGLVDEDILDVVVFTQKDGAPPASPPQGKIVLACFAGGLSLYASVPRLRAVLTRLGGEVVEPPNESRMTHYITENLRTYRALTALLNGVWVVRPSWLLDCDAGSRFITEAKHALAERQQPPPYAGKRFFLSTSFKNAMSTQPLLRIFIRLLVLANAKLIQNEKEADHIVLGEAPRGPRNRVLLTWWELLCLCPPVLSHNLSRQAAETLLSDLQNRGSADVGPVEVSAPPASTSPEPAIVRTPPPSTSPSISTLPSYSPSASSEVTSTSNSSPVISLATSAATLLAPSTFSPVSVSEPLLQEQTPSLTALADRPLVSPSIVSPTPARRTLSSDLSSQSSASVSSTPTSTSSSYHVPPLNSPRRTLSSDLVQAVLPPPSTLLSLSHNQPQPLLASTAAPIPQFHPTSEAEIQELDFLIENLVSSSAELESHLAITPTTAPQSSIWMIPGLGKTRSWLRQVESMQQPQLKQRPRADRGKRRGKA